MLEDNLKSDCGTTLYFWIGCWQMGVGWAGDTQEHPSVGSLGTGRAIPMVYNYLLKDKIGSTEDWSKERHRKDQLLAVETRHMPLRHLIH